VSASDFPADKGTMEARIRAYDWSATALGPPESWPQSLRSALRNALRSKFPAYLVWGPERISFYNDAYLPILGAKPDALGQPVHEVWPEAWDILGPIMERAFQGEASYFEDMPLTIQRNGYLEETWWTFSYSPIEDETGRVEGMLSTVHETTHRMLTERRLQFLVNLGNRLRALTDPRDVMAAAADLLGRYLKANRVGYGEIDVGNFLSVERDWTDISTPSFSGRYRLDDFGPPIIAELKAERTIRIDDASVDPRTAAKDIAAAFITTGKRATVIVPLIKDGLFIAVLFVHQAEPRHWRDDEVALAQEVAERTWEAVRRARAEAALRESEESFRQFAEHSTTVLWIIDAETRSLRYVSPAYEVVWGEPASAVMGGLDHWIETIHPDDREQASRAIERVLEGEIDTQEYHIIRPDGGVRWIRDTFFPIRDEQGRVRRAAGVAQDITQHEGSMVYIVDGNEVSRRALSLLLQGVGYEVKAFASAQAFLEVAPVLVSGCVMLDTRTSEAGDLTIPKELKARRTGLPVVVIGEAHGDVNLGVQAMKAGAVDFLDTPYRADQLLDALASAQAGIRDVAERNHTAELVRTRIATLSAREREVLDGLLAGGTNKVIARDLGISPRTVEAHRARIMERLGAQSLPELVQIAVAAGLQVRPQGTGRLVST
jgi:PAS domain S-box-containing protein